MAERHIVGVALRQFNMEGVAQLAERYTVDVKVAGSFPVALP